MSFQVETRDGETVITKAYSGIMLEHDDNRLGICYRDDTMEINIMPKGEHTGNWWRVNMQKGTIECMRGFIT